MRLICPNCTAQYEVGADAIPEAGREVLCSACDFRWFAAPPTAPGQAAETAAQPSHKTIPSLPHPSPPPQTGAPATASPEGASRTRRRALDDAVVSILREEAEREARARQRDPVASVDMTSFSPQAEPIPETTPASQSDRIPHAVPPHREPAIATRPAPGAAALPEQSGPDAARANAPHPEPEAAPVPTGGPHQPEEEAPQVALRAARLPAQPPLTAPLPDIAEITSALHATARIRATTRREGQRRGFRLGFGFVAGAAAALVALYALSPIIRTEWPALAPALSAYETQINLGRQWLDAQLR
ncbi:zinc-ribbon domain-containing protein [Plastorhodobacter daqingensis]|uniref:Zinc-ribbon domain-containing protein n=1 Tax=Plastorhodobacter daqingensis TaxID=1387281 RepID=A0ABW2UI82_9RHOB